MTRWSLSSGLAAGLPHSIAWHWSLRSPGMSNKTMMESCDVSNVKLKAMTSHLEVSSCLYQQGLYRGRLCPDIHCPSGKHLPYTLKCSRHFARPLSRKSLQTKLTSVHHTFIIFIKNHMHHSMV